MAAGRSGEPFPDFVHVNCVLHGSQHVGACDYPQILLNALYTIHPYTTLCLGVNMPTYVRVCHYDSSFPVASAATSSASCPM